MLWFKKNLVRQLSTGIIDSAAYLGSGVITAAKLASDAVTTAKILDANVTAAKLAADAVTTAKILDANVTAAKLAADAVETAKILDGNVTTAKLAANAVTAAKLDDFVAQDSGVITVSSSEVLNLNATPKELVAAPGASKYLIPHVAVIELDFNSAAYAGIATAEDLQIRYTDGSGQILATIEATGFLDASADAVRLVYPLADAAKTPVANAALVLHMSTGEITTGDSPLKVQVKYSVFDSQL